MDLSLATLLRMARETVQSPREGARMIMTLNIPIAVGWTALALMAVLSALFLHMDVIAMRDPDFAARIPSPFALALMQFIVMVISAQLIFHVGRWRGGRGRLADAVMLSAWLQFILVCIQAAQIVLTLVLPPAADVLGVLGLGVFFWLLTNFIAEMHGFPSLGRVFIGIIVTVVVISFALGLILTLLIGGAV